MADACPDVWDVSVYGQGSTVNWPEDTLQCEGSGGVTNCIREEAGTIGYIDAGHGHLAGLEEVYIENRAGTKLTTLTSSAQGGIAAAADVEGLMPASPTDDFSQVSLINQVRRENIHSASSIEIDNMLLTHSPSVHSSIPNNPFSLDNTPGLFPS